MHKNKLLRKETKGNKEEGKDSDGEWNPHSKKRERISLI